jgi:hypothetical protein
MMELQVSLDFACCACGENVGVTVQCSGQGLVPGARVLASVCVPCPGCGAVNRLEFEPSGTLHAVRPHYTQRPYLEPSIN